MAYSEDLRKRVLRFVHAGGSKAEAARRYEVHLRTIFVWLGQGDEHQRGKPGPRTSRKFSRDQLAHLIAKQPDALLKELAQALGVQSINTISHALKLMGISRKKKRCDTPKPLSPSATPGASTSSNATTRHSKPSCPSST